MARVVATRISDRPGRRAPTSRSVPAVRARTADAVLALQTTAGNRATTRLIELQRGNGDDGSSDTSTTDEAGISKIKGLVKFLEASPLATRKPDEAQASLDLWLSGRAGNVHDIDVTKRGLSAAGETSGGVGAGGYGRAAKGEATHTLPIGLEVTHIEALLELGAFIGAEGKVAWQAYLNMGGVANLRSITNIKAFAGALARAKASGGLTFVHGIPIPVGMRAEGSAEVFAGAKSSGTSELTLLFNVPHAAGLGLGLGAGYDAKAGAGAKAEGKIVFEPLRGAFAAEGKAETFAGVSVEGTVEGSAKLYKRKVITLKGKASASAGAGGKAEGKFESAGGKVKIGFNLSGALGVGTGAGTEFEADFKPIAVLIAREAANAKWRVKNKKSTNEIRNMISDYRSTLDGGVKPKLVSYRDYKLTQLRMNRATNYIKEEKVQMYIDANWPRPVMKKHAKGAERDAIDRYIESMIKSVFSVTGTDFPVTIKPVVKNGKITSLQTDPPDLHVLLGGGIEGRHAHGKNASATNLLSDVGK